MSKLLTGTRSFAKRTSSSRLSPAGSANTPDPSMIATVLSELRRISSAKVVTTHNQLNGGTTTHWSRDHHLLHSIIIVRIYSRSLRRTGPTRTSGLHFGNVLLLQPKLFVDADNILSHRQGRHAVGVMRHSPKVFGTLSGGEGLPPGLGTTSTGMHCFR